MCSGQDTTGQKQQDNARRERDRCGHDLASSADLQDDEPPKAKLEAVLGTGHSWQLAWPVSPKRAQA